MLKMFFGYAFFTFGIFYGLVAFVTAEIFWILEYPEWMNFTRFILLLMILACFVISELIMETYHDDGGIIKTLNNSRKF